LRNALVASDQASEEIAEKFLSGETSLDKFLGDYLDSRKVRLLKMFLIELKGELEGLQFVV
jgi:hypothetical protein